MQKAIACFENVTRRFGDLIAVNDANLEIFPGEVTAILGENGAGKSTLMKLLYGVHLPSSGRILINGEPSAITGPADAMINGVGMVFQNFSLLSALTVRDNLLLAWPKTPYWVSENNKGTKEVLANLTRLAPHINPHSKVSNLSVGEQQLVELCKVLNISARIVILDEPTSVLTPAESRRLHGFIRQLADEGVSVVLITHKLADVEACADRIAVMRKGQIVDVSPRGQKSMSEIVTLMMGSDVKREISPPALPKKRVEKLFLNKICATAPGMSLKDISLSIAAGEVVGLAGVAGNGQALLAEVLAGIHPATSGDVALDGISLIRRNQMETLATPLGYIPELPRKNAVVENMTLAKNLNLRALASGKADVNNEVQDLLTRFHVNPPEIDRYASTLSGGNLQKLVSARELGRPRAAILACYPTMGLDISAIQMIYREIFAQAEAGAAVLWISEDLDDLIAGSHRIAIIRDGQLVAVKDNDGKLNRDTLGAMMTGLKPERKVA
ncbi:ABC transporter ATP-binding protein [Sneathiella litorea]|uniref:ATP-binding cassette domain-containing protein n=1 Tax=Sneathiella litorea TaxID=2606216 RepID=A0A6L8W8C6_9PROT|nr:ATP-binding cassette domain-containing protein [Sneathiella litorea]MZR30712.1 ATP-binding cassette domain-containing protein [Sneathiella litorea]